VCQNEFPFLSRASCFFFCTCCANWLFFFFFFFFFAHILVQIQPLEKKRGKEKQERIWETIAKLIRMSKEKQQCTLKIFICLLCYCLVFLPKVFFYRHQPKWYLPVLCVLDSPFDFDPFLLLFFFLLLFMIQNKHLNDEIASYRTILFIMKKKKPTWLYVVSYCYSEYFFKRCTSQHYTKQNTFFGLSSPSILVQNE
jgi:hypothetical protein